MATFADRLKELRKESKTTQRALVIAIEMLEQSFQDLEYGRFKPSHDNIIKLSDFFDVSTDYLLGRSDDPARH